MTSNFEILVQSAPLGKQIGIHWRNAKDPNQSRVDFVEILGDHCLPSRDGRPHMKSIESVINKTKPSVLFGQHKNKIFLFVAGISGREISVTISQASRSKLQENVLWMLDKNELDAQFSIRCLAAYAVAGLLDPHSDLQTLIRDAIDFNSEDNDAFTIDTSKLQQIHEQAFEQFGKSQITTQSFPAQSQVYYQSSLETLADQIANCPFPDHETIVIVAERKQTADNIPYLKYQGNIAPSTVTAVAEPILSVPSQPTLAPVDNTPKQPKPEGMRGTAKKNISRRTLLILAIAVLAIIIYMGIQLYQNRPNHDQKQNLLRLKSQMESQKGY